MISEWKLKKAAILILSIGLLFVFTACESIDNGTLTTETYSVTFTVTDSDDNPVEGAEVVLESTAQSIADGLTGTTGSDGKVTFVELEGEYAYTISSEGKAEVKGKISPDDSDSLIRVPVESLYSVTFKVRNTSPGIIENAEVVVEGETKYTDSYGLVDFENLNGKSSYTISRTGYLDANGVVTSDDAGSVIFVTLVMVDETAPTVNIISPAEGAQLGDSEVTVEWEITDQSPYLWELYLGGSAIPELTGDQDDPHRYTFDPAAPDHFENFQGEVIFRVKAVDDQNNENSDSVNVDIETRADLTPDLRGGNWAFELNSENQIVFHVKNQGNSAAAASTARAIFYKTDGQVFEDIPTPSLEAGESTSLTPIDIPPNTANPDINFDIIVDINDEIDEADEANNEEDCIIVG